MSHKLGRFILWWKITLCFLLSWVLDLCDCTLVRIIEVTVFAGRVKTTDLVNMIFNFCELYSGKTMFPYQAQFSKRVIRSILLNDGEEITALFARQSGKSETIAITVGGLMIMLPQLANMPMFAGDTRLEMFKDGLWVGIFAPGKRQAEITYNRVRQRLQCKTALAVMQDPEFNLYFHTSNGQTCSLSNGSFVTCISASDQSNIEGESFKLIICEECQDISNYKIRKSIHPMGAAYNATIVKIGTATTFKGDFYDAIQRNKTNYEQKKKEYRKRGSNISTLVRNHFEYDYKVAAKYNPKYAKYVEQEMKRLGENSDEFRMAYKLEWIIERGMFVDIDKFEVANGEPMLERVSYDKKAKHVAGIDVGGKNDDTIITIVEVDWSMPVIMEERTEDSGQRIMYEAYNTFIVDWCCIANEPDYEIQYNMIIHYLNNFWVVRVVCDATREASLAHRLRANLRCEVIPYIFTTVSKSELYKLLDTEISSGRARVPCGEATKETKEYKSFMKQLGDLQKGWSGAHMVCCHGSGKDDHDDYCDSWALAAWGASSKGEENNTETRENKFMKKTPNEKTANNRRNCLTARRMRRR